MGRIHVARVATERDFQIVDLFIDGNGIADHRELASLRLPETLDWSAGVVLNGRIPLWLEAWAAIQCAAAPWLAVFDPRLGAVVVRPGGRMARMAEVIPLDSMTPLLPRRDRPPAETAASMPERGARVVAVVGPPHSGKSVFLRAAHEQLRATLAPEVFQGQVFLLRACPDGEGNWFGEIPAESAALLRHKNQWDDEFVDEMCRQIEGVARTKRLVLVDFGGRIDRRAQRLLGSCNAALIVSRDAEAAAEWRGALRASGIQVLGELESVLHDASEVLARDPLRVRFGPLARETPVQRLPEDVLRALLD